MFKVHIDKESALRNISSVIDTGFFNEGVQVKQFSESLSRKLGIKNIVLTNSCTSALTMALKLSGVGCGDEVISTSMTCLATNTPILNLGGKIVWADIDPKTGNICPKDVMRKITNKTKAVMCVNWAGLPCDLRELMSICQKNKIKLIQDAAHSFGSLYKDTDVSNHAHFTCYSFQAIKHITCGDGGALICLEDKDLERARSLKWFGLDRESTKDEDGEWKGQRWEADVVEAGYKFNMNNISASIGLSQVDHIDSIIKNHRENALQYEKLFSDSDLISPLLYPDNSLPSFWVYTVLLDKNIDRDKVIIDLNNAGIGAGLVHIPNHNYTCFRDSQCDLPGVDYFHSHQISLPCGWWINKKDIEIIVATLIDLCKQQIILK